MDTVLSYIIVFLFGCFLGTLYRDKKKETIKEVRDIEIRMDTEGAEGQLKALEERTHRLIDLAEEYNKKVNPSDGAENHLEELE